MLNIFWRLHFTKENYTFTEIQKKAWKPYHCNHHYSHHYITTTTNDLPPPYYLYKNCGGGGESCCKGGKCDVCKSQKDKLHVFPLLPRILRALSPVNFLPLTVLVCGISKYFDFWCPIVEDIKNLNIKFVILKVNQDKTGNHKKNAKKYNNLVSCWIV